MNKSILILICFIFSFSSVAKESFSPSQLKEFAEAYIKAKASRQQPDATVKDIDNYISLLANDFIDEHVKYNFTYTDKAKLKSDMVAKLKDEFVYSHIKIQEFMYGSNSVFIKVKEKTKVRPHHLDKVVEHESTYIHSLEFNEKGLIKHIRRHVG